MPSGVYKRTKKHKRFWFKKGNTLFKGKHHTEKTKKEIGKSKKGEKSSNWKGGKKKHQGYWLILKPNHLKASDRYVKKAVLVMEKKIGRLLTKEEIVHHIGAKDDDGPNMLYLFFSQKEHKAYHLRIRNTYKKWKIKVGKTQN